MFRDFLIKRTAIIGAGRFCRKLLEYLFSGSFHDSPPQIIGVADIDPQAPGLEYARRIGLWTTGDYHALFRLPGLEAIWELTGDHDLSEKIRNALPPAIQLVDHFETRLLWDTCQVADVRSKALQELERLSGRSEEVKTLVQEMADRFEAIIRARNLRARQIEMELVDHRRTQSQIIAGSTIPTFVIDKDHLITHWNKAMERLTGVSAAQAVGTRRQWYPFYSSERPTMADVILDQVEEGEVRRLYGSTWRKSALIEDAYEAEVFFPHMGESGTWCWFTAAPLKGPDGAIIGAIETLWDKSDDKRAQERRERYMSELAALVSIYTALSAPVAIGQRVEEALAEVRRFLSADCVSIFLTGSDRRLHLTYAAGSGRRDCSEVHPAGPQGAMDEVAREGKLVVFENLSATSRQDSGIDGTEGLKALALVPVSAKEKRILGVMRVASRRFSHFSSEERHVLELIGNRIGVALENAMLREQSTKSEEKYRSLFNNDPNPIFIVDCRDLTILDTNRRAQDCYGYRGEEFAGLTFSRLGEAEDPEVASGMRQLSENQSVFFHKKKHLKKSGQPFYVNINVSHARYGEHNALIAATTDITESIEQETQLIQASKMTTLGLMAAGMAHEINQPLNVIQICADFFLKMLGRGEPIAEEDLRSMAGDIVTNVARAANVIRHVREFSRQSEVVRTRLDLNDPIRDVFKVLGHQVKAHRIELQLELSESLPPIMADHNRLEQVFINLVTNAIDAMDEKASQPGVVNPLKRLTIRSWAAEGRVSASVADTGTGMSEQIKLRIFEPFFTTKKIGKGTGLGISISYGIIRDYEGRIDIRTELGQGSEFTVSFPAATGS